MAVGVGDVVRLVAKMQLLGTDDMVNVLHYKVTRNATLDDLAFMTEAALFLDVNYTFIQQDLSDQLTFVSVDGQNITQNELLPEVPWPLLVAGLLADDLLPSQVAAMVFWPTITPRVRTSLYVPGYTESSNGPDGEILVARQTRLITFSVGLQTWNTADVDADKGSQHHISAVWTPAGIPKVPTRWRTQRRRRIGVGS